MLDLPAVSTIIDRAATATLKGVKLSGVNTQPAVDSIGNDALHVTIVVAGDAAKDISGDEALDVIVRIQQDLQRSGDDRFAIVDFATEDEMRADGDPQS